jgi:hypothetical protein
MKNEAFIIVLAFLLIFQSCKKDSKLVNSDFCSVKPVGWDCEIYYSSSETIPIPQGVNEPKFILKFSNKADTFSTFYSSKTYPFMLLYVYDISQKTELQKQISNQAMFSWCIPIFYGENKTYYVITSPCYINSGNFSDDANNTINSLHQALKRLFTSYNKEIIKSRK